MINCAHPTHFGHVLEAGGSWLGRLRGIRANASRNSHAELDAAAELDAGDPHELATEYASLMARFPQLTILGGCCGTDDRHIEQIAQMCITSAWPRTDALRTGSRTDALRTGSWTDAVRTVY
jgi:S-methylmethionine-dependent homocysteine/selenocysteine methylase